MTSSRAARRPLIQMIDKEAEALTGLAIGVEGRLPQVAELLLDEIGRAKICKSGSIAADIVVMNSTVAFLDTASGRTYDYQLVYPKDANISAGRISILTPVGAGLIGLREGQSILWPDRSGNERTLTIVKVSQIPRDG